MQALKWVAADEEGLVKFLVGEKSFNEDRVRKAVQRVNAAKSKSTQGDLCKPLPAHSSCGPVLRAGWHAKGSASHLRSPGELLWQCHHQEVRHREAERA